MSTFLYLAIKSEKYLSYLFVICPGFSQGKFFFQWKELNLFLRGYVAADIYCYYDYFIATIHVPLSLHKVVFNHSVVNSSVIPWGRVSNVFDLHCENQILYEYNSSMCEDSKNINECSNIYVGLYRNWWIGRWMRKSRYTHISRELNKNRNRLSLLKSFP